MVVPGSIWQPASPQFSSNVTKGVAQKEKQPKIKDFDSCNSLKVRGHFKYVPVASFNQNGKSSRVVALFVNQPRKRGVRATS
jgi:hypothetical protein